MNPLAVISLTIKNLETLNAPRAGVVLLFLIALGVTLLYALVRREPLGTMMLFAWSPVALILLACVAGAINTLGGK